MSLHSYHVSRAIEERDPPFYALIMAAIRKADTDNLAKLTLVFPEVIEEFRARYNAGFGVIPEDGPVDLEVLAGQISSLRL